MPSCGARKIISPDGGPNDRITSPGSCPSPDLIRGLLRASTSFLLPPPCPPRHAGEGREGADVDGRDKPAMTPSKWFIYDRDLFKTGGTMKCRYRILKL